MCVGWVQFALTLNRRYVAQFEGECEYHLTVGVIMAFLTEFKAPRLVKRPEQLLLLLLVTGR